MSNYILLTDPKECPACRKPFVPSNMPGECRNCGKMLFKHEHNFRKYESDTGWREYYVWTGKIEGWKHRSQILSAETSKPIESIALEREYKAPKLEDDYGTPDMIKRRLENSRVELKSEIKKLKKKPVTVRVKK